MLDLDFRYLCSFSSWKLIQAWSGKEQWTMKTILLRKLFTRLRNGNFIKLFPKMKYVLIVSLKSRNTWRIVKKSIIASMDSRPIIRFWIGQLEMETWECTFGGVSLPTLLSRCLCSESIPSFGENSPLPFGSDFGIVSWCFLTIQRFSSLPTYFYGFHISIFWTKLYGLLFL